MGFHIQPEARHAYWILDPTLSIQRIGARDDMEKLSLVGDAYAAGCSA